MTILKRVFDVIASAFGIASTHPLWGFLALAIKWDSAGPVFYRATRVGKDGKHFALYKFRTMVLDADRVGPGVTGRGDPRVTAVGRFLRRTKLDELPQLINVLKGDMSVVGPRPEDPRYVAHYTDEQRRVLAVRPGLISPAVLKYRHEEQMLPADGGLEDTYLSVILPDKLRLDLEYVERQSFLRDLSVVVSAFKLIFERTSHPHHPDLRADADVAA